MVVAIAGLAVSRIAPDGSYVGGPPPGPSTSASPSPSPSGTPSAAPIPTTLRVPVMTEPYVSALHGYSITLPADWSATPASQPWSPPAWKLGDSSAPFDFLGQEDQPPWVRAASAPLPEGLPDVNHWIDEYLTFGDPSCVPPRETQEPITIDGAPGRLWDDCSEVEATVVQPLCTVLHQLDLLGEVVRELRPQFEALRPAGVPSDPPAHGSPLSAKELA